MYIDTLFTQWAHGIYDYLWLWNRLCLRFSVQWQGKFIWDKMLWNRPHVCSIRLVGLSRILSNVIYDRTVSIEGVCKILNRVSVDYLWRYLVIWDSWQFPLPKINSVDEDCVVLFHYLVSYTYGPKFFPGPLPQLLYLPQHVHNRN
jgi:hypothetical protein